jgi:hypothetical protein
MGLVHYLDNSLRACLRGEPLVEHRKQRDLPPPELREQALKSNQCYFDRHAECWLPKLCECKCHQVMANASAAYNGVAEAGV